MSWPQGGKRCIAADSLANLPSLLPPCSLHPFTPLHTPLEADSPAKLLTTLPPSPLYPPLIFLAPREENAAADGLANLAVDVGMAIMGIGRETQGGGAHDRADLVDRLAMAMQIEGR